jgi:hypothetical protein
VHQVQVNINFHTCHKINQHRILHRPCLTGTEQNCSKKKILYIQDRNFGLPSPKSSTYTTILLIGARQVVRQQVA